ncbi:hypothetical protein AVEN_168491-1, partial [Araneus ventricosus]
MNDQQVQEQVQQEQPDDQQVNERLAVENESPVTLQQ